MCGYLLLQQTHPHARATWRARAADLVLVFGDSECETNPAAQRMPRNWKETSGSLQHKVPQEIRFKNWNFTNSTRVPFKQLSWLYKRRRSEFPLDSESKINNLAVMLQVIRIVNARYRFLVPRNFKRLQVIRIPVCSSAVKPATLVLVP